VRAAGEAEGFVLCWDWGMVFGRVGLCLGMWLGEARSFSGC